MSAKASRRLSSSFRFCPWGSSSARRRMAPRPMTMWVGYTGGFWQPWTSTAAGRAASLGRPLDQAAVPRVSGQLLHAQVVRVAVGWVQSLVGGRRALGRHAVVPQGVASLRAPLLQPRPAQRGALQLQRQALRDEGRVVLAHVRGAAVSPQEHVVRRGGEERAAAVLDELGSPGDAPHLALRGLAHGLLADLIHGLDDVSAEAVKV
eukprot:CAMPEP_0171162332 /NCGR_PEP_ID=MMETSP0790-20130122/4536_1 /TAXON_ID=2925 /ORGANISM="Alexandrium catenella, Strain OF101" /LENGTH=205 /DNA_ID=CAMNT_0011626929 /DNA_START=26 /DNA_END=640 /DNA_ORIENTATION=-